MHEMYGTVLESIKSFRADSITEFIVGAFHKNLIVADFQTTCSQALDEVLY